MRVERVLSLGKLGEHVKGIDSTRDISPDERVSLLEDLREQVYTMVKHEYPRRLSRILTVIKKRKR